MKLYRICTENKNYPDILDYLDEHFPNGYIVMHANGAWQGIREKSLIIEIISNAVSYESDIGKLAFWLKKHNKQEAVLLQVIEIDNHLP